jgi:hypothetical protein
MSDADPDPVTQSSTGGPRALGVYGETWVYESIVGAIPGVDVSNRTAVVVQFAIFETALLALAAVYDLQGAILPGTAAILVASAGSAFMLDIGGRARDQSVPRTYRRLLFASSIEVVLGVVAYVTLLTYLFVYDPRDGATLFTALLGERPPLVPAALALLVLWDVCYRIGTGWWAAVVALWRSLVYDLDGAAVETLRRVDAHTVAFGLIQLVLVPFVWPHPPLVVAVVGHVVAVVVVAAAARGTL